MVGVHAVLLGVVVGSSATLSLLSTAHGWRLTLPAWVRPLIWALVLVVVVLTVHLVGRRSVERGLYRLTAPAGWIVAPLAWVALLAWTSRPDIAWVLLVLLVTPIGWVLGLPLLAAGAAVHQRLLRPRR